MNWLYRSLVFLAVAGLLAAGVLRLNRLGALKALEMTGMPDGNPAITQIAPSASTTSTPTAVTTATNTANNSATTQATTAQATTAQATAPTSARTGGPSGERPGGFNWPELGRDLAYVVGAWLALAGLDRLARRFRPLRRPARTPYPATGGSR